MERAVVWLARGASLFAVCYLAWLYMPDFYRARIELTLAEVRDRVVSPPK